MVCKLATAQQDQGRSDVADGSTDKALTTRKKGLRVYVSRAIEHKRKKGLGQKWSWNCTKLKKL